MKVPKGWEYKDLKSVNIIVTDGDRGKNYPKSHEFLDQGYCLFLSAKNVTKQGFIFKENKFISKEKHNQLRKGIANFGDVILTTRGSVGHFAIFDKDVPYSHMRINSGMVILSFSSSNIMNTFFYSLCRSFIINTQIEATTYGSAQPQLTVDIIKKLKIPVPPLPEQRKIAKILGCWDRAIAACEQLIATSKQQKQALMQQLLTAKKRFGEFTGEWKKNKLHESGIIVIDGDRGKEYPKSIDFKNTGYCLFLTAKNVTENGFLFNENQFISKDKHIKMKKGTVEKRDIVLTTRGSVGNFAFFNNFIPYANMRINSGMVILRNKNIEISNSFLYLLLRSNIIQNQIKSFAFGSAQPQLTVNLINKLVLFIPTLSEQQKIAQVLTAADSKIDILQQKLAKLQQEKQALMQQLLTGKRRVKVDESDLVTS